MSIGGVTFGKGGPRRSVVGLILRILGLLLLLALAGIVLLRVLFEIGLPRTEGRIELDGPLGAITITRDGSGIPWIRAESARDAAFAVGFVHGQDRLAQLEMTRRIASGRLAELIGSSGLRADRFARTLGIRAAAERSLAALSPEFLAELEAYAAGINAAVASRSGPLPVEFVAGGIGWEPWTPLDSLLWGKAMALMLSGNLWEEFTRARLAGQIPPEMIEALLPGSDPADPVTLSEEMLAPPPRRGAQLFSPSPTTPTVPAKAAGEAGRSLLGLLPPEALALAAPYSPRDASNAWVIAGRHTLTGKPILANDPHLEIRAPVLWYLARIETPQGVLAGGTAPGVPMMLVGHNGTIAWGLTTTHADTQDLVLERIDPADPSRYLTPDGSQPFLLREEQIAVRFGEAVTLTVRETRHGPVVSELDERARAALSGIAGRYKDAGIAADSLVVAFAWPALTETDRTIEGLWRMNRARNWQDFLAAASLVNAPLQNVFYADTAGNTGLVTPGLLPIRDGFDGREPVPGWGRARLWEGFVPFEKMPKVYNPAAGLLVNANNRLVPESYPYPLSRTTQEGYRARRILDLIGVQARHSVEDSARIQLDSLSLMARELLPLMLAAGADPNLDRSLSPALVEDAYRRLERWDGDMHRNRPEPLIFLAWVEALHRALWADELGVVAEGFERAASPRFLRAVLTAGQSPFCDDTLSATPETCADRVRLAFVQALARLKADHGGKIEDWRWGRVHRARFEHPLLARLPLFGSMFVSEVETNGDDFTVNRASPASGTWRHRHGAGLRAVFDLADLDSSRFTMAGGQSANPFSLHFADMAQRWRDGVPVRLTRKPAGQTVTLTLVPTGMEAGR